MKKYTILTALLAGTLLQAIARESIREGEQSGIPDRADVNKEMKTNGTSEVEDPKKEVRENQEDTDPVFYDSTTSPKEMEEKDDLTN